MRLMCEPFQKFTKKEFLLVMTLRRGSITLLWSIDKGTESYWRRDPNKKDHKVQRVIIAPLGNKDFVPSPPAPSLSVNSAVFANCLDSATSWPFHVLPVSLIISDRLPSANSMLPQCDANLYFLRLRQVVRHSLRERLQYHLWVLLLTRKPFFPGSDSLWPGCPSPLCLDSASSPSFDGRSSPLNLELTPSLKKTFLSTCQIKREFLDYSLSLSLRKERSISPDPHTQPFFE